METPSECSKCACVAETAHRKSAKAHSVAHLVVEECWERGCRCNDELPQGNSEKSAEII